MHRAAEQQDGAGLKLLAVGRAESGMAAGQQVRPGNKAAVSCLKLAGRSVGKAPLA